MLHPGILQLTCDYPSRPPKKTVLDNALIQIRPRLSHHAGISDRDANKGESKIFQTCGRAVQRGIPCLQSNLLGDEQRRAAQQQQQRRKRQSFSCVFGPQRARAKKDEGLEDSYSLLKSLHKSK
ncbi:hypothetical protein Q5P01_020657 [Channa striata]|uniref:Uncharacterized protein n=1 Tax=Channa striata TaxID=64152 RepID=A0AA88LY00_CHASR|nr:hypothetical protein Q5P01_020657 [Channa striata]